MNTDLKEALLPDHDSLYSDDDSPRTGRRSLDVSLLSPRKVRILLGLFAASVILNAFLLTVVLFQTKLAIPRLASRYANLEYSQELLLPSDTEYSLGKNATQMDDLWESIVDFPGVVALDGDFVKEKHLPPSYPFPWDDSKGVYIVAAYHSLHCLRSLYISVTEAHRGHNQSFHYFHLVHCLDRFRQEIMCHADDTLYHVQKEDNSTSQTEYNIQSHQCRDWNKLDTWARERTACYTYHHFKHPHKWDNYKNCPSGSPYLPKVREHFGLPLDWVPTFNE